MTNEEFEKAYTEILVKIIKVDRTLHEFFTEYKNLQR